MGILSVFMGYFVVEFMTGYFATRANSENAIKAQVALDRIAIELKDITAVTNVTQGVSISYTTSANQNRVLRFQEPQLFLNVDGTDWELLNGVSAFTLSAQFDNMNGTAGGLEEFAYIDVGFTMAGIRAPFTTRIFPRNMVTQP